MADQHARQDGNQFPAQLLHTGTAGTSETVRATGQASGAANIHVTGGTVVSSASLELNSGTITTIQNGTQQTLGTVGVLNAGSVSVISGTSEIYSSNLTFSDAVSNQRYTPIFAGNRVFTPNYPYLLNESNGTTWDRARGDGTSGAFVQLKGSGGTISEIGVVAAGSVVVTAGTIAAHAITNLAGGSVVVTTGTIAAHAITNLAGGTVTEVASVTNLVKGTITRVEGGSVVMTAGTVSVLNTVGTVGVLNNGSVVLKSGTLTTGTLQNVASGSMVQTAGTLTTGTLQNLVSGTITALGAGTITAGTVRQQWQPVNQVTSFGTLGTAAGSLFGTISAASGAGTKHMISGLSVVVATGTVDVRLLVGTAITGGSVLTGGALPAGAGIQKSFTPPIETGTNSELTYHFVGAGTAFITVQYWKSLI